MFPAWTSISAMRYVVKAPRAKTLELHWAKNKCFRYQQAPETGWHMMIHGMPTHQPSWIATRKATRHGDAAHQGNWLLRASAPWSTTPPSSVGVCHTAAKATSWAQDASNDSWLEGMRHQAPALGAHGLEMVPLLLQGWNHRATLKTTSVYTNFDDAGQGVPIAPLCDSTVKAEAVNQLVPGTTQPQWYWTNVQPKRRHKPIFAALEPNIVAKAQLYNATWHVQAIHE